MPWRLKFAELENIPRAKWPSEAVDYAIGDAVATLELYEAQEKRAYRIGYELPTQHLDARADFALRKMSVHGIAVDQAQVQKRLLEARAEIKRLVEDLKSSKLITVKKVSDQRDLFGGTKVGKMEVKKNLGAIRTEVEKRHPHPIPYTEKGAISTTKEVLSACKWGPFDTLLEYTALEKLISTYWGKLDGVPVIHASFVGVGAASGRTTCHAPNLQNQPRRPGVRECFVPRPGYVFISCDFDSQEMRTLAQSCLDLVGHSRLAERYQEDTRFDPHMEFAKQLAKGAESADLKYLRQQAKACNFGYPGGLGDKTLVDYAKNWGLDLTEARAKELRAAWLTAWPEMREYFRHVDNLVGASNGTVDIPQSGFRRAGVKYTDACNTYFQTLAAHASKHALWDVAVKCYCDEGSHLYRSRPVIFLHDEIILETPEFVAELAARELETTMIAAMHQWTPDVPASAQSKIMQERWSK